MPAARDATPSPSSSSRSTRGSTARRGGPHPRPLRRQPGAAPDHARTKEWRAAHETGSCTSTVATTGPSPASWAGEPKHPAWYLNLQADPDATIQIGGRRMRVRARELEGEERALVWKEIVAKDPSFAEYEERTARRTRGFPSSCSSRARVAAASPGGSAYVVHGLTCSYFTGQARGVPAGQGAPLRVQGGGPGRFPEDRRRDGASWQLPALETPEGTWLTDTTADHRALRIPGKSRPARAALPIPRRPSAACCSKDLFDEWYWRPALYYRWAFDEDATAHELADRARHGTRSADPALPRASQRPVGASGAST